MVCCWNIGSSGKPLEGTYYNSTVSTCGVILIGFFEQIEEENKKKGKESNLFVFGSRKNWNMFVAV